MTGRQKLIGSICTLLGSSLLAFFLGVIAPGDPALEVLSMNGLSEPTEAELAAKREELGLNLPIWKQYMHWLGMVLQGDLGVSYITQQSVSVELIQRLPITLSLACGALVFAIGFGIPSGIILAMFHNRWIDYIGRVWITVWTALPSFLNAILFIIVFSEILHWLPTSGYGTWQHFIMPSIVLGLGTSAVLMRLTRAAVLDILHQPYIVTAKAKGIHTFVLMLRHVLLNAFIPLITVIGNYFGGILGGAIIAEVIFSLPGIGRFAVEGIFRRDYPVMQGYVLFTACVYVLFNTVVDILYGLIHPQLRRSEVLK